MKQVKVIGWASILFLLIFTSCREDILPNIDEVRTLELPEIRVEASVSGQVIDENFEPIQNASVRIGELQTNTDENGAYSFSTEILDQNGTYITVEKSGYYLGAKMFNPSVGAISYVPFQLLEKELTGSFQSSQGGVISTTDGVKVSFGANSIRYENGADFNGEVEVYAKWIDPSGDLLTEQMPGDLRAWNTDEELVQLATYGMVAVELETSNGSKLQLVDGSTATLEMIVPDEILAGAPSTIPLWSFDEATGYWIEEGTATLQDGKYIGEVPHFSFWNCDAPFPVVKISGTVVNSEGEPIPFANLQITLANAEVRGGFTNSEGVFCGKVPKNEVMTLTIFNNCYDEVGSIEIGPFTEETDIGEITGIFIESSSISGTLVNCDGDPVTEGYVMFNGEPYDRLFYADLLTGEFFGYLVRCEESTGTIVGYDLENLLQSDPLDVTIPVSTNVDVGEIEVCDEITQKITVTIDELGILQEYFIYELNSSQNGTYFSAYYDSTQVYLNFIAEAPTTGSVPTIDAGYSNYDGSGGVYLYCDNCTSYDTELTVNDGPGGALEGVWEGKLVNELSTMEYDVKIEFNLIY